nr:uracil-DNA glycosylase [Ardenticatena sp.]
MSEKAAALEALRHEAETALAPLLTPDQTQIVFGEGNPDAPLMLVGEAPGPQEDREGRPFVGKSGQLLEQVLTELGLDRSRDVWVSNVVKVWPTRRHGRSLRTRPPNAAERRASWPFFEREVRIIQPKVLLLIGGTAAKTILGRNTLRMRDVRGTWLDTPFGIPALVTYHPSYILRMQGMRPEEATQLLTQFRNDVRTAAERAGVLNADVTNAGERDDC